MGTIQTPKPAMLFCGILSAEPELAAAAEKAMAAELGPVAIKAGPWPWDHTDYYESEMGTGLKRRFLAFERFQPYTALPRIKHFTNEIEVKLSPPPGHGSLKRSINLDPGLIDLARVVLATTKEHAHRIYLDNGVWGDLTLTFAGGQWRILPWTYPDYRTERYHRFLYSARNYYKRNRNIPDPD